MKTACIITLTLTTLILPTQAEDFVQKQGDTMTGTLTLQAQDGIIPALEIQGQTDQWKFFRLRNTQDDSLWDITMDQESNGLSFWYAAPGTEAIHLSIDTNGIIYGNGAGLTNLNVLAAIPDGSITAEKLETQIITQESLTNGHITSLSIGNFIRYPWGAIYGENTVANNSLSVGQFNTATNASVAIGNYSTAGGRNSFAVGSYAKALGEYSFASGQSVEASGNCSTAIGQQTIASGAGSLANGYQTTASGSTSIALGNNTTASGNVSYAWGYLAKADNTLSHAAGWRAHAAHDATFVWSSSDEANRELEFASTTNSQFNVYAHNGIRLHTSSGKKVEINNGLSIQQLVETRFGITGNNTVGNKGFAVGKHNRAKNSSIAVGEQSIAEGTHSFSLGYFTRATSLNTAAMGERAMASHTNTFVWSSSNDRHNRTFASTTNHQFSVYAHNGIRLVTSPDATIEIGGGHLVGDGSGLTNLNITLSHIEGSFTAGDSSQATGPNAFAIGNNTTASGDNAHAQGWITTASGWNAHAQGGLTTASETAAHAQGWRTAALGWASHAQGGLTIASNQYSHAQGLLTAALGDYAHAQGFRSIAAGTASHAAGWRAHAAHDATFVWSSSDEANRELEFASTTNSQFNVYAHNGIRLVTSPDATIEMTGNIHIGHHGDIPMFGQTQ